MRGEDYNLANERLPALDRLIDPGRWSGLCQEARQSSAAEVLSRGTPSLRDRCHAHAEHAERELGARLAQLRLRLARRRDEGRAGAAVTARDLEAEEALGHALVSGIRSPELRLDSVGFIVVSGKAPPAQAAGGD